VALKATIYKAQLAIADIDRGYYATHSLTLACHPSETEERLMLRVFAFVLFAGDDLAFTRGLSTDDEPDLWARDLTGRITHWIELGTPDESRIRKGCNRAERVTVLSYGSRQAGVWWDKQGDKLARFENLQVIYVSSEDCAALAGLVARAMDIQATLQEGQVWLNDISLTPQIWKA